MQSLFAIARLLLAILWKPLAIIRNLWIKNQNDLGNRMAIFVYVIFLALNIFNILTSWFFYSENSGYELYLAVSIVFSAYCLVGLRFMSVGRTILSRNMAVFGAEASYLFIVAGEPYVATSSMPLYAHVILIATALPILSRGSFAGLIFFNWFVLVLAVNASSPNLVGEVALNYGALDLVIAMFLFVYRLLSERLMAQLRQTVAEKELLLARLQVSQLNTEHTVANVKAFGRAATHDLIPRATALIRKLEALQDRATSSELIKLAQELQDNLRETLTGMGRLNSDIKVRIQRIDLVELLKEIANKFALQSAEAPAIRVDVPDERIIVNTDDGLIERMLHNLIANAQGFTPETGSITLRAASYDDRVTIEVIDTGSGMSPEKVAQIRKFGYTETSRGAEGEHFGVGILSVHKLAEKLGITVGVESTQGKGTTFTLTLPKQQHKQNAA